MSQENINVGEIQATTRISQAQASSKVAEVYLAAIRTRNMKALGSTLHPDLQVVGLDAYHLPEDGQGWLIPNGEHLGQGAVHNRASFLETMRNVSTHLQSLEVAARPASSNQSFYMFNLVLAAPAAHLRTAHVLTHHENGQIQKIEIVADKSDFHTYLKNHKK